MRAKQLTDSQRRALAAASDLSFEFVGRQAATFSRLESMGLVEGRLEPAEWDSRRGITSYKRAFRRTAKGRSYMEMP